MTMRRLVAVTSVGYGSTMTHAHVPQWPDAIAEYLDMLRAGGSPETTINTRRQHLEHAAARIPMPPWQVNGDLLLAYFAAQEWAPETRRGRRATMRSFYGAAARRGRITTDPSQDLPSVKPAQPKPRPAPDEVLRQTLAAASPRERLMVRLAAELGLRRAEVAVVHARDIVPDLVGWSLVVHGKGRKDRRIPLPDGLAATLRAEAAGGWLFPGQDGGHLSPRWVGKLLTRIMPDGWTMHALRHRFATRAYALNRDLFVVQDLLGHSSPATTRVYVALPRENLRATVERLAS